MTTGAAPDLAAVKARQQATWASGDFAEIATLIVPVAELLADAADLRAGSSVLDVATGSGNAAHRPPGRRSRGRWAAGGRAPRRRAAY